MISSTCNTLIASSQELEGYALDTNSKLAHFLDSWARFKKFNYVPYWLIDISNSNSEHSNKFNFCMAINWPIDVGSCFNLSHLHNFNFCKAINWPIVV